MPTDVVTASCPARGGSVRYDPALLGGGARVPYIASWTGEKTTPATVIRLSTGRIGYVDEMVPDRDRWGVLWMRSVSRIGAGRPLFATLHPWRQRRAMLRLLCQVCAQPADQTEQGTLWLLRPGPVTDVVTSQPPVCRECARISVRMCPALRPGHVAFRARSRVCGVSGVVYRPIGRSGLVPTACPDVVPLGDPVLAWTQAAQLSRMLFEARPVDLERLS